MINSSSKYGTCSLWPPIGVPLNLGKPMKPNQDTVMRFIFLLAPASTKLQCRNCGRGQCHQRWDMQYMIYPPVIKHSNGNPDTRCRCFWGKIIDKKKWGSVKLPCGSVSKPCTPGEHQNSWDLWMFIPLKMVLIGIDPYPCLITKG